MDAPFPFAGEAFATSSSLLWAVGALLFTKIPRGVSASALNLGKNAVGAACFLGLLVLQGSPVDPGSPLLPGPTPWTSIGWLVLGGVAGLTACDVLLLRSFRSLGPRRTNIVMALSPVLVAALAFLPPLGEAPGLLALLGMTACLVALGLAVLEKPPAGAAPGTMDKGVRDALLAAGLQAAAFVFTRMGMQDSGLTVTEGATIRLVAGVVGMVFLGLARGRLWTWVREIHTHHAARPIFVASLIGTFLGIWTNQAGISWAGLVGVAATLNALTPVWLVPLSSAFLGEHHDRWAWASALLAVIGIALVSL